MTKYLHRKPNHESFDNNGATHTKKEKVVIKSDDLFAGEWMIFRLEMANMEDQTVFLCALHKNKNYFHIFLLRTNLNLLYRVLGRGKKKQFLQSHLKIHLFSKQYFVSNR